VALVYQGAYTYAKGGFKAGNTAGRFAKGLVFFFGTVGGVIGGDKIYGSVLQSPDESGAVSFGPERRIEFRQGSLCMYRSLGKGKVLRRYLGADMVFMFFCRPYDFC
jgi:hypothetical protein